MSTIINGSSPSITFSDSTTQSTGVPAPSTSGNVLTSNGSAWTSAASAYVGAKGQSFTSGGTFTIPTGVTALKVTVQSAGGGGGSGQGDGQTNGGNGGASSFGTYVSCTGGGGGKCNAQGGTNGTNGSITFGAGTSGFSAGGYVGMLPGYGAGGQFNGGAGAFSIAFITGLTPGETVTVTVGSGGAGGTSNEPPYGGAGGSGYVFVEW